MTRSLCFSMVTLVGSAFAKLPNIVIIYADDLGFGDLSCYKELNCFRARCCFDERVAPRLVE